MMSDEFRITYRDLALEGIIGRNIFDTLPEASSDNLGNHSFQDILVCADKTIIPYLGEQRRVDLDRVYAATGQRYSARETEFGIPFIQPTIFSDTYELGALPSPLQTRCEEIAKSREK